MYVDELDTPAVLIDLDRMEQNMRRLKAYCQRARLQLRPHTKTHKIPELAKRQIAAGAHGITVAKIGEARVMVEAGLKDLLVAYPIVSEPKADQLARLAEIARIAVSLDSTEAIRFIGRYAAKRRVRIGIFIEVDVGFHRCGCSLLPKPCLSRLKYFAHRRWNSAASCFIRGICWLCVPSSSRCCAR